MIPIWGFLPLLGDQRKLFFKAFGIEFGRSSKGGKVGLYQRRVEK